MRQMIGVALIIAAVSGFGAIGCGGSDAVGTTSKGEAAPGFELKSLDGDQLKLSDYSGKVVLVDFWATWCGPCRMSIPHLVALQKKYGEKGFQVIGISLDRSGVGKVKQFAGKYKINYPIVMGNPAVTRAYGGVRSIPQAFVIDREGNVRESLVGYRPAEELDKIIRELL